MSVVAKLGAHGSNRSWTVEQMLEDALDDVRAGKRTANRALVVFLEEHEGHGDYNTGFSMANLSASEAIALMRVMEAQFLKLMNII